MSSGNLMEEILTKWSCLTYNRTLVIFFMKLDHQLQEIRSLRMHGIVAEIYRQDSDYVVRFGLENLKRWQRSGVDCEDFQLWREILELAPERLPDILSGKGEEAVRLRQSSPFAGLVPEESRRKILAMAQ
jgi:hypothetical protein